VGLAAREAGERQESVDICRRTSVEPEQLPALLDAADEWHRPMVATLAGAGLRVGEATALEWRDVNLATGTLMVRDSKTDAGTGRRVDLPGGLVDELSEWKARSPRSGPSDPVFVSRKRNGRHNGQTKDGVGRRLKVTIKRANERLAKLGIEPISERVSPHSLRRTYASLRAALRDDPIYIAEQIGHEDPGFTFRVYQKGQSAASGSPARTVSSSIAPFNGQKSAESATVEPSRPPRRRRPRTREPRSQSRKLPRLRT
jgi:integrase